MLLVVNNFFEWTNELDVHVDAMNHEHKELILKMNNLYDANYQNMTLTIKSFLKKKYVFHWAH